MRQIQGLPSPSYRKSIKFIRLFFNVINVQERSAKENQNPGWFFKYFEIGRMDENKNVKNSQLSNDQTVTLAENNSKAIFIRCIANICKGSVKNTIKRDVSISAVGVVFKEEIKVTAVNIFTWHLLT